MITAIVLAAGSSQRMGHVNKLLLKYKSKTIIETTIENVIAAKLKNIVVVAGYETEKIKEAIEYLPVEIIYNPNHQKGMTTSIQVGIEHAREGGYMICLADMFMITAEEYALMKKTFEKNFRLNA